MIFDKVDIWLPQHDGMPLDQRPTFTVRWLSAAEQDEFAKLWAAMWELSETDADAAYNKLEAALGMFIVSTRNVFEPKSQERLYHKVMNANEVLALVTIWRDKTTLTERDLKKLLSRSDSDSPTTTGTPTAATEAAAPTPACTASIRAA